MFTVAMGATSGFPSELQFHLRGPGEINEWYRLIIEDADPISPGQIAINMTDEQRREFIHVLGGIPVEPTLVHAGQREAPADAPAEGS